jgi:phosphoribosylglycinamide formyltransferase 1
VKKIAVFASGTGTNTARMIEHFASAPSALHRVERGAAASSTIEVALIVTNKPDAGVLKVAADNNIPSLVIDKERFFRGDAYITTLQEKGIDWIILAGFLWKIPVALIRAFPGHIINIHPALLPKYGGKGMYGQYVHQAVIDNKEKESGITIHFVDEIYDHGAIIFQSTCPVVVGDNPAGLESRVRELELEHYPRIIEALINEEDKS